MTSLDGLLPEREQDAQSDAQHAEDRPVGWQADVGQRVFSERP